MTVQRLIAVGIAGMAFLAPWGLLLLCVATDEIPVPHEMVTISWIAAGLGIVAGLLWAWRPLET